MEEFRKKSGNKKGSKKVGCIKDLDILDNVTVRYGSAVKNKPKSIYINFNTWTGLKDRFSKDELDIIGRKLNKRIRQYVNNNVNRDIFNEDKTILIEELRTNMMGYGKSTHGSLELTLFQRGHLAFDDKDITAEVIKMVVGMNTLFTKDETFTFNKTKVR